MTAGRGLEGEHTACVLFFTNWLLMSGSGGKGLSVQSWGRGSLRCLCLSHQPLGSRNPMKVVVCLSFSTGPGLMYDPETASHQRLKISSWLLLGLENACLPSDLGCPAIYKKKTKEETVLLLPGDSRREKSTSRFGQSQWDPGMVESESCYSTWKYGLVYLHFWTEMTNVFIV